MKTRSSAFSRSVSAHRSRSGFTLIEIIIAAGLFGLVILGSLYCHLMGLKMSTMAQAKLKATNAARSALNRTRDEIRSAAVLNVGAGDRIGFTNVALNGLRQGNALQIYPTGDTNNYIRYYLDPTDKTLKRIMSNGANPQTIANYITNQIAFYAEDFAGNVLTNDQNNRVIRMNLEFSQWEFDILTANGGSLYEYYAIQTRTARRALQ